MKPSVRAVLPLLLLLVLLAMSAPPWPDDWDGLGFLASIKKFDMDHFAPHAPGYPVYVALLRAAALALPSPIAAAYAVAIGSGLGVVGLVYGAASHGAGAFRGAVVALGVIAAPLVWRTASAVGSEAPALFFAALAVWALVRCRGAILGIAIGLGLGVRLSWAPLFLGLLLLAPRGSRSRALVAAAVATAGWAIPLIAGVGYGHLLVLMKTHLAGHATRWGGTALSDPGLGRIAYFARDVFVDGLGIESDGLGITTAVCAAGVCAIGVQEWRRASFRGARQVAIVFLPYAVWVMLGQNVRQQPRHVLPIVVALSAALALGAVSVDRARTLGVALLVLMSLRTLRDADERRTVPPPGAQLVLAVRALPPSESVAVFGGPSVRFFEGTELAARAFPAGTLGDVRLSLGRMNELPRRTFVTSELEGIDPSSHSLTLFATLCRPDRIDRRAPCISVYELGSSKQP